LKVNNLSIFIEEKKKVEKKIISNILDKKKLII